MALCKRNVRVSSGTAQPIIVPDTGINSDKDPVGGDNQRVVAGYDMRINKNWHFFQALTRFCIIAFSCTSAGT